MAINWQEEVNSRKDELMEDLYSLIRIDSVKDLENKTDDMPVGPGPAKALHKFLEIGERDGFITKNIENVAGHIEYGEGDETLGVLAHVDVVPTGDGWDTDPFEPVIKDGKLYARGSSDDKGPAIAAYYALKIIKDLGLPVSKKVRYIIGTDEESGWYCMDRYQANEKMPDFGFSPDAQFPIINGEKGIATFLLTFPNLDTKGEVELKAFHSGLASNMVPGNASATIVSSEVSTFKQAFESYIAKNNLGGSAVVNGNELEMTLVGKACHAQNPSLGVNAGTHLANFLKDLSLDASGMKYVSTIAEFFHLDPFGKLTGIDHTDAVMGELTSSPNIFVYEADGQKTLALNVRFPKGTDADTIIKQLTSKLDNVEVVAEPGVKGTHYVPATDPLVVALLGAYEDNTGEKGSEKTIGGGTYGRLFERGCAFGAMFPGREDTMHQANEYMYVEDIFKSAAIYADAIYRLIK